MKHLDTLRAMLRLHEQARPAHHGKNDGMCHPITDQHWTDVKEALEYAIQFVEKENATQIESVGRHQGSLYDPDKRSLQVEPQIERVRERCLS